MSGLKGIEWIGPTRVIPEVGVGEKGCRLYLPGSLADSLISQGLAKAVIEAKVTKDKGEV